MTDHDAELDALTAQLVEAGLLETSADDGDEAMPSGRRTRRLRGSWR